MVPQSLRQAKGVKGRQLLLRLTDGHLRQSRQDCCLIALQPIDGEGHLITIFCQMAGSIAGQFQNGRATHAPMGDKQRTLGTELRTWQMDGHIVNHRTRQPAKPFVVHTQTEQ